MGDSACAVQSCTAHWVCNAAATSARQFLAAPPLSSLGTRRRTCRNQACASRPPPAPDVEDEGAEARAWVPAVLGALAALQHVPPRPPVPCELCPVRDRDIHAHPARCPVAIDDVQDGPGLRQAPLRDLLLRVGLHAYALEPLLQGVPHRVVPLDRASPQHAAKRVAALTV